MKQIVRWLMATAVIMVTIWFLHRVLHLDGIALTGTKPWLAAAVIAALLGLLNATVRPILKILTLPINLMTLGLFSFVITAFLLWLSAYICQKWLHIGFYLRFFPEALLAAVMISVLLSLLSPFVRRL